eukprot:tig00000189_g14347.t1
MAVGDPGQDHHVSNTIFNHGFWEPHITALARTCDRRPPVHVATAAERRRAMPTAAPQLGFYSLLASALRCPAHAFEVQRSVAAHLAASAAINGFDLLKIHENAASDVTGRRFSVRVPEHNVGGAFTTSDESGGGAGAAEARGPQLLPYSVETVRLDDAVPPGAEILVMKVDVEGHEPAALRGAEGLIARRAKGTAEAIRGSRRGAQRAGARYLLSLQVGARRVKNIVFEFTPSNIGGEDAAVQARTPPLPRPRPSHPAHALLTPRAHAQFLGWLRARGLVLRQPSRLQWEKGGHGILGAESLQAALLTSPEDDRTLVRGLLESCKATSVCLTDIWASQEL